LLGKCITSGLMVIFIAEFTGRFRSAVLPCMRCTEAICAEVLVLHSLKPIVDARLQEISTSVEPVSTVT
jgi:hypothetical protein